VGTESWKAGAIGKKDSKKRKGEHSTLERETTRGRRKTFFEENGY